MKKIFTVVVLMQSLASMAQDFCERRIAGPEFYGSSTLVPMGNKIYHFYSVAPNGLENRTSFFVKGDYCLNVIDSVKVPLDSGLYRTVYDAERVQDRVYCISQVTDMPGYDPAAEKFKYEIFVYDTSMVLQQRIDLDPLLGQFNFTPELYVLGDSVLMITSAQRSPGGNTAFTLLDLQGNLLSQNTVDSLYLYASTLGKFSGGSDFFMNKGSLNYNFQISPFQIISIDTFTTVQQQFNQAINSIPSILCHPNGDTYMVGICDCNKYGNPGAVIIYRMDSVGHQKGNVVYGSTDGRDVLGNDVAVITSNGDIVIASYREKTRATGLFWDLIITRLDSDLNMKWEKTLTLHNTSFISVGSAATPDNGATFVSVTTDSTTQNPSAIYNDLHYLHIDSTGYYSPLSAEDFGDMLSSAVSIYPNPVSTVFNVEYLTVNETYQVGIYDVHGKLLNRTELTFPFELKVDGLSKGTYLLILQDKNGDRITRKFVKE